jgi:hypothetical protein
MSVVLILLVLSGIAAVVALVRGLAAFLRDAELIRGGSDPHFLQRGQQQNRMMMQRVLFQGMAIAMVALLGLFFSKS